MISMRTQRVLELELNFSRKPQFTKQKGEKLGAQKDAGPTADEAKRLEASHEEELKIAAAAEAAASRGSFPRRSDSPSVPSACCTGFTSLRGFNG